MAFTFLKPVIFCGPSGSGKSTLIKRLMAKYEDCFAFSVSHTTRNPREGEVDGVDYHFILQPEMERLIANDEFLEHAEFSGHLYGTSKSAVTAVQQTGRVCLLDMDIQGVQSVKEQKMEAKYIFIKPPTLDILEKRLRERGTDSEDTIKLRMETAKKEIQKAEELNFFDAVIVNDSLDQTFEELENLLVKDVHGMRSA